MNKSRRITINPQIYSQIIEKLKKAVRLSPEDTSLDMTFWGILIEFQQRTTSSEMYAFYRRREQRRKEQKQKIL